MHFPQYARAAWHQSDPGKPCCAHQRPARPLGHRCQHCKQAFSLEPAPADTGEGARVEDATVLDESWLHVDVSTDAAKAAPFVGGRARVRPRVHTVEVDSAEGIETYPLCEGCAGDIARQLGAAELDAAQLILAFFFGCGVEAAAAIGGGEYMVDVDGDGNGGDRAGRLRLQAVFLYKNTIRVSVYNGP